MKILYIPSNVDSYRLSEYNSFGSPIARDRDVSIWLGRLGHDVDLVGGPGSEPTLERVRVIAPDSFRVGDYDLVVMVPEHAHGFVRNQTDQLPALREHPNVIAVCDQWLPEEDDLDYARAYLCSSARAARVYRERYPDRIHQYARWAITEFPSFPSPWASPGPRAVFCGLMDDRCVRLLNLLAATGVVEVWVGGFVLYGSVYRGISERERQILFRPEVRFMTDLIGRKNDQGPIRYGDQIAFYQHAEVGLCFAREPFRRACVTSKLYDHWGAGLPTAVEEHTANAGEALELGAGAIFPYDDAAEFVNAVKTILSWPERPHHDPGAPRRHQIRSEALATIGTWADRAKLIESIAES